MESTDFFTMNQKDFLDTYPMHVLFGTFLLKHMEKMAKNPDHELQDSLTAHFTSHFQQNYGWRLREAVASTFKITYYSSEI